MWVVAGDCLLPWWEVKICVKKKVHIPYVHNTCIQGVFKIYPSFYISVVFHFHDLQDPRFIDFLFFPEGIRNKALLSSILVRVNNYF